jgi:predicted HicB family RNase H-like nuclease
MQYKGCTAHIEFDDRDNIFVGRVLGVTPIIGFHGETMGALRRAFEVAGDDFLADSAERGVTPGKSLRAN